jgi:hypothetical protein
MIAIACGESSTDAEQAHLESCEDCGDVFSVYREMSKQKRHSAPS